MYTSCILMKIQRGPGKVWKWNYICANVAHVFTSSHSILVMEWVGGLTRVDEVQTRVESVVCVCVFSQ